MCLHYPGFVFSDLWRIIKNSALLSGPNRPPIYEMLFCTQKHSLSDLYIIVQRAPCVNDFFHKIMLFISFIIYIQITFLLIWKCGKKHMMSKCIFHVFADFLSYVFNLWFLIPYFANSFTCFVHSTHSYFFSSQFLIPNFANSSLVISWK